MALTPNTDISAVSPWCGLCSGSILNPDHPDFSPMSWLSRHVVLGVGKGIIAVSHPTITQQSLSAPDYTPIPTHMLDSIGTTCANRKVALHEACLKIALVLAQDGDEDAKAFLVSWTIPKHTGFGPWDGMTSRYDWGGLEVQKKRWSKEVQGSHLSQVSEVDEHSQHTRQKSR